MKILMKNKIKYLIAGFLLSSSFLFGVENTPAPDSDKLGINNIAELLNISGKQRMLSQRIAKDYMYLGKKIAVDKAEKQLSQSLKAFKKSQRFLNVTIDDPDIKNLITFINLSEKELEEITKKPFSLDNAQLVLDLSETMLEGSQYVVDSLKKLAKRQDSIIVATSGKQRMLSQRIAKYYIAYQSGIRDKNTVDQMKAAVKLFDEHHKALINYPSNTVEISQELKDIDRLWKIVYKFYLNIEKGGLPFIVFISTDNITSRMDKVTGQYTKLAP